MPWLNKFSWQMLHEKLKKSYIAEIAMVKVEKEPSIWEFCLKTHSWTQREFPWKFNAMVELKAKFCTNEHMITFNEVPMKTIPESPEALMLKQAVFFIKVQFVMLLLFTFCINNDTPMEYLSSVVKKLFEMNCKESKRTVSKRKLPSIEMPGNDEFPWLPKK